MFKNIIGLFLPDSTDFPQNGTMASFRACAGFIGTLPDCIEPRVVEELNGAFEFTFQYPCDGVLFPNIQHGSIVVTMPRRWVSQGGIKPQAFRVYEITTPLNGIVTVNCQHVSYDMASAMLFNYDQDVEQDVEDPTTGETHKEIVRYKTDTSQLFTRINSDGTDAPGIFGISVDGTWHPGILDKNTFPNGLYNVRAKRKIQTTNTTSSSNDDPPPTGWAADADFTFKIDQPTTLRAIMCDDDEEGITKALKGFWTFDNWNAMLDTVRGKEIDPTSFNIQYKVNMTEMKSTVNCPLHYTHVYPYYKDGNTFLTYSIPAGETTEAPEDETANLVPIYNDEHPDPYLYHASTRFEVDERPKVILPLDLTDKIKAMMKTGYDSITGIQLTKLFNLGSLLSTNVRTLWSVASSKNDGKKITLSWTADPTSWPNGAYISKHLVTVADPRLMIRSLQNPITNTGFSSQTVNAANAILEMMPEGSVIFLMKGTKYLSYYNPTTGEFTISEIETSGFYQKVGASMILRNFDGYCEFDSEVFSTLYNYSSYAASFTLIQEDHYNLGTMVDDVIDSDFEEEYPENAYDLAKMTVGDACLPSEHWDTETIDSVMEIIGKPYEDIGDRDFVLEYPDVRSYIRSVAGAIAQNGYDTLEHGSAWIFQHTAVVPGSTESQIQECLRQLTDEYIEREFLNGIPKDISVSFYDDGEQSIEPGDIVTVYNSELIGSSGYKAAIVKIEYDPAADVYTGIEYGDLEEIEGLSATIDKLDGDKHGNVVGHESSAVSEVKTIIEKTSGIYDGYVKIGRDLDDPDNASYENPNELMVVDNTDLTKAKNMWRWDSKGLISYRKNPNYTEPEPWDSQNAYSKGDVVTNGKYYYEARKDIPADTAWSDSNWKRIKVPRNKWVTTTAISIDGTINAELIKAGTIQGVDIIAEGRSIQNEISKDHGVYIKASTGQMQIKNSVIESYANETLHSHAIYAPEGVDELPEDGTPYDELPEDSDDGWHTVPTDDDIKVAYTWDPDTLTISEYDDTHIYNKGDYCKRTNGTSVVYYKALRDGISGEWKDTKWMPLSGMPVVPVWEGPYDYPDYDHMYRKDRTFYIDPNGLAYFNGAIQGGEVHVGEVYDPNIRAVVPAFNIDADGNVISYGNMKIAGSMEWGADVSPTQVLYAADSTAPSKPTDGSRWSDYPEHASSGWHRIFTTGDHFGTYTWDGGNTWTEAVVVVGEKGEDGSGYVLEIDNDFASIPCNSSGSPSISASAIKNITEHVLHVFYGVTEKSAFTISSADPSGGSEGDCWVKYVLNNISGTSVELSGHTVSISGLGSDTDKSGTISYTLYVKHNGSWSASAYAKFEAARQKTGGNGDNAVIYKIVTSDTSFHKDKDGNITPSSITAQCYKVNGSSQTLNNATWKVNGGTVASDVSSITIYPPVSPVTKQTVEIYIGGTKWDSETIGLAMDGNDGPQGPKGDDGDDAVVYTIEAPDTLFHVNKGGTITPTSIVCTSYKTVGNIKSTFTGYMEAVSGGTTVRSSSASTITIYGTDFASSNIVTITLYENSSKATILASHTIGRIVDGADGGQGEPGTPGPAGDDGVSYTINATSLTFHKINGVINPNSITCTAYKTLGDSAPSLYSGYWKVECGSMTPITYSNTNNIVIDDDIFDDEDAGTIVRVNLYSDLARTNLLYTISLTLLTDGRDGVNEYIHVAYAPAKPTSAQSAVHQTPQSGDTWLGTYTGTKPQWIAVNWVTEASWVYIKGDPGSDGDPGRSSYLHVAYAPNETPSTSQIHQTPQTGDTWIGTCENDIAAWSASYNYVWVYIKGEPGSDAEVTAWNTFNALTDGGRMQGIFYYPPLTEEHPEPTSQTELYINASAIKSSTADIDYLFARQLIGKFNNIQIDVYDPDETYNTGDVVLYPASGSSQHKYEAKEDGITGAWNANKWEDLGAPGDRYLDIYSDHIIMHGDTIFTTKGELQDGVTVISGANIQTGVIGADYLDVGAIVGKINNSTGTSQLNISSDHIVMVGTTIFTTKGELQDGVTVISGANILTGTISADRINVPVIAGRVEEGLSLQSYPPQILQYTNSGGDIEMDSQNEWIIPKASVTTAAQTGWASFTIPAGCNMIYIGSYSNGSWPAGSMSATQYLVITKDDTTIRNYYVTTPSKGIRENAISVTPGSTVRLDFTFVGGSVGLSTGWAGIQVRTASRNSSVIQLRGSSGLISAAEINIVGMVKFTDLLETGTTTINGANIITGSIKADKIDATNLHVTAANIDGTLTASQIDATNLHVHSANIDELIITDQLTLLDGSKFDIQAPASFGQLAAKGISVEGSIDTRHAVHANTLWLNEQTITSGSVGGTVQTERYKVTCTAVSGSSNKFKVRLTRTTIGYYNYSDSLTFNFYYKLVASGPIKGYVSKSVQFNISASETLNVYDEHEIELTPERSPLLIVYRYTFDSVVGTETIASDGTFQRLARSGSLLYPEKVVIVNSSICGIDTSSIQTYSPVSTYTKGELVQWMNMSTLTNQIYKCKVERAYNISPGDPDHGGDTWQYVDNASSTSSLCNLGSTYRRWDNTYLRHNPDVSSDANVKHDIDVIDDKYDIMFDNLRPTQFMYNGGDRIHLGLIAQEVEEAMQAAGIDNTEFGGFCKDSTEDGDIYGLRYGEFIGLLIKEVQTLKKRVNQLEQGENENEGNETEPEPDTTEETLGTEIQ